MRIPLLGDEQELVYSEYMLFPAGRDHIRLHPAYAGVALWRA